MTGCAPDPFTQFFCDGQGNYYSRTCHYTPECDVSCTSWASAGSC